MSNILLGLAEENYPPDAATDAFARFIQSRQSQNGLWRPFSHRPPSQSGEIPVTATSLRALQVYGPKTQRAMYDRAVKLAAGWLMTARAETTQDRAYQLLGLGWAGLKPDNQIIVKSVPCTIRSGCPLK